MAIPNLAMRRALTPWRLQATHQPLANELRPMLDGYDRVMAWADSTASHTIGPLLLAGLPFTHGLFRDCANLLAPQKGGDGQLNWINYQRKVEGAKPPACEGVWRPPQVASAHGLHGIQQAVQKPMQVASEIFHYSPAYRSEYSRDLLIRIARDYTDLPMRFVTFEHTFTGSPLRAQAYMQQLRDTRILNSWDDFAKVWATLEDGGYHSDLENAPRAVTHIEQALGMTSLVNA